jgi:hypothetical protein
MQETHFFKRPLTGLMRWSPSRQLLSDYHQFDDEICARDQVEGKAMPIEISVQCGDVANVPSDLLLLKHAQNFYGADLSIVARLTERGVCREADVAPAKGKHVLLETGQALAAERTLFLGTPSLRQFRYPEMTQFARRAINLIGEKRLPIRTLTTTVHGPGYGLDIAESLRALILGFQQGLATSPLPQLAKIIFAERNARRCELLQTLLQGVELVSAPMPRLRDNRMPSPRPRP